MSKTYKVLIDPLAKNDIRELLIYISINDDLKTANKIIDELEKAVFKLEKIPDRGHIPAELKNTGIKRFKEIIYKHFRIIYQIDKNEVYVHAVLDGRRNVHEILTERIFRLNFKRD